MTNEAPAVETPKTKDELISECQRAVDLAIDEADLILFIIDFRSRYDNIIINTSSGILFITILLFIYY